MNGLEPKISYVQSQEFEPAYPQYNPNLDRAFNQLTSTKYDVCQYENELRVGSKPMKYFVNQFNSPQMNPFMEFTPVGNQQVYSVQNSFDHPLPTRLNPLYQTYVFPYATTPFLGQAAPSMMYADTSSNLRFGSNLRDKKSAVTLSEIDYNRQNPGVSAQTVVNAGQFTSNSGRGIDNHGYYDYMGDNNVIFMNGAVPWGGVSSRNELHNQVDINNC